MGENKPINILLIEDDAGDVVLIREYLAEGMKSPCNLVQAGRLDKALEHLAREEFFDVILLDLGLPDTQGYTGFERVYARVPRVPIIVLTGRDDDALAIETVQKGAQDYLVKGQVNSGILVRAIRYAIERQKLRTQLESSLREIKTLRGFLPICASCKKIRDDKGYWTQMEMYISEHTEAEFSHGLCPDCADRTYAEFLKLKK
jgi:DNA-binding NarL/FixJ family response regulator